MPEVRPVGPVHLVDAPLGVVDRVKVALLLEHDAAVVLVHDVRRAAALRGLARDRVRGGVDAVARVDLQRGLVRGDVEPVWGERVSVSRKGGEWGRSGALNAGVDAPDGEGGGLVCRLVVYPRVVKADTACMQNGARLARRSFHSRHTRWQRRTGAAVLRLRRRVDLVPDAPRHSEVERRPCHLCELPVRDKVSVRCDDFGRCDVHDVP